MEVLLESLFMPLPVYPIPAPEAAWVNNLDMAGFRIPADDAITHPDRQVRLASRVCSFMKLLTEKVNWRMGNPRLYIPPTTSRQLSRKRKHAEIMLTEPLDDDLSYHNKRQLVFISQAIRDYTNEGLGHNSFQLGDADSTVRRIWIYLTRHFGRGEINFTIDTSIAHIHLLMRSAIPRLLSGIEQSQPPHPPGQGLAYFPPSLQIQDTRRMDLHFFDLLGRPQ